MSKFFSKKYSALTPYTPGEQPKDMQYIKLNTNESPFPPSPKAQAYAKDVAQQLHLYPDPTCRAIREQLGALYGLEADEVIVTNGSAGELTTRIDGEKGNPQADLMWGGLADSDGDAYCNAHGDSDGDSDGNAYCDAHGDSDGNAYCDTYRNAHGNPDGSAG